MTDGTDAPMAMMVASSALKIDLAKQGLDGAGIVQSTCEGPQRMVECLPLTEITKLPQLLSNLAGALQQAAKNPASLVHHESFFTGCVSVKTQRGRISARERECHQLSAEVVQAHAQLEKTSLDLKQGLTKFNSCALEKVSALQGLPEEFTRLADLAAFHKFSDIDLNELQKIVAVNDVQKSISEVCDLYRQVKESASHMNAVLNDVLTFLLKDLLHFMEEAAWGVRTLYRFEHLLPTPKISVSAKAMLNQVKEIALLATDARDGVKGYAGEPLVPDSSDAVEIRLCDFSTSLGKFEDRVKQQLENLSAVVESAKDVSGVSRPLNPVLALHLFGLLFVVFLISNRCSKT